MFENAPGFMAMLSGPEHVFQYVNPAYSELIGFREAVGRTVAEVLPEAVEQGFAAALTETRQTGEPHSALGALLTIKGPGGASFDRYVDFVYQPIKNACGEVTDIFVSGSDITERMEADTALRRSEARLRFLDELNLETGRSRDADAILAISTRMVGAHLSISNCAYADMDEDGDGFTIRGDWAAEGSPSIVGHYSLAAFGKLAVKNLNRGQPLIVNDNLAELAPEEAKTFQDIGIAATICMPLVREGKLTALMAIHDKVPHVWTDEEQAVIREVTERSWAHIQRVWAEAELRESAAALSDLNATPEARVDERTAALVQAEGTAGSTSARQRRVVYQSGNMSRSASAIRAPE
ncbi:GAF domain-containing protein [Rhizobium leguminosarum]